MTVQDLVIELEALCEEYGEDITIGEVIDKLYEDEEDEEDEDEEYDEDAMDLYEELVLSPQVSSLNRR